MTYGAPAHIPGFARPGVAFLAVGRVLHLDRSVVRRVGLAGLVRKRAGERQEAPAHWPADSQIALSRRGATLMLFAHPHCPCTRATLGELEKIVARCPGSVTIWVLFLEPAGCDASWRPERSGASGCRDSWRPRRSRPRRRRGPPLSRHDVRPGVVVQRTGGTVVQRRDHRVPRPRGRQHWPVGDRVVLDRRALRPAARAPVFGCPDRRHVGTRIGVQPCRLPCLNPISSVAARKRADELFREHQHAIFVRTDRMFAVLLLFQWVAGIVARRSGSRREVGTSPRATSIRTSGRPCSWPESSIACRSRWRCFNREER